MMDDWIAQYGKKILTIIEFLYMSGIVGIAVILAGHWLGRFALSDDTVYLMVCVLIAFTVSRLSKL